MINGTVAGYIWLLGILALIAVLTLIAWVLPSKPTKTNGTTKLAHKPSNKADSKPAPIKNLLKSRSKLASRSAPNSRTAPNKDILRLNKRLNQHFPTLTTKLQHNRIIAKEGANKFMLTIDKKVSKGGRQLGDARVVNFHSLPSVNELQQLFERYKNKTTS